MKIVIQGFGMLLLILMPYAMCAQDQEMTDWLLGEWSLVKEAPQFGIPEEMNPVRGTDLTKQDAQAPKLTFEPNNRYRYQSPDESIEGTYRLTYGELTIGAERYRIITLNDTEMILEKGDVLITRYIYQKQF